MLLPTRHPRKMITINPTRASLLDQLAAIEGKRPHLGELIDEGARTRLERLRQEAPSTQAARMRVADLVRAGAIGQDSDAADRIKRLGLER
jgi:hypothetical protein